MPRMRGSGGNVTEFVKRPYRELVAETQATRDQYFAALRAYYRAQIEAQQQPVRRLRPRTPPEVPIFTVQPEKLAAPPPPPEPPPLVIVPEVKPTAPVIEATPQSNGVPENGKTESIAQPKFVRVASDEDPISEKSQLSALMIAESAHQRNLADIADQRFRQWARARDFGYDDDYGAREEL